MLDAYRALLLINRQLNLKKIEKIGQLHHFSQFFLKIEFVIVAIKMSFNFLF